MSSARNPKGQEVVPKTFKTAITSVTVYDDHYLSHELSNSKIPHVALTCLPKHDGTFIGQLRDFLGQGEQVVTQALSLSVWKRQSRIRVRVPWGLFGRSDNAELLRLEINCFHEQQILITAAAQLSMGSLAGLTSRWRPSPDTLTHRSTSGQIGTSGLSRR
jgi:hypothetical protein